MKLAIEAVWREKKPLLILTLAFMLFYYKFFLLGFLYLPADIVNHWIQPWCSHPELREQMPENPILRKIAILGDRTTLGPVVSRPGNPEISDPAFTYLPGIDFNVKTIMKGELPLWNDTQLGGYTQLGDVTFSLFHPFNFLYFIPGVSIYLATAIRIMLTSWLAGVFFYFLAIDFKVNRLGALAGAMTLMLCGQAVTFLEFISFMDAYAFMPLLFLLYRLYARRGNGWLLIWGALTVWLIVMSRNPKPISYILVFFTIYQVAHVLWLKEETFSLWGRSRRALEFLAFCCGLGIALAMAMTLPMVYALSHGLRTNEMGFLNPAALIAGLKFGFSSSYFVLFYPYFTTIMFSAIFPYFFGSAVFYAFWSPFSYVEWNSYLGFFQISLVGWLMFQAKSRAESLFMTLFVFVLLIFAFIPPFHQIFNFFVPGSGMVRLLYIYSFFGAMLVALAVDKLLAQTQAGNKVSVWHAWLPIGLSFVSAIMLASLLLAPDTTYDFVVNKSGYFGVHGLYEQMKRGGSQSPFSEAPKDRFIIFHILHAFCSLVFCLGTILLLRYPSLAAHEGRTITFLFLNLAYFGIGFNPTISERIIYRDTGSTKWLRENIGDGRIFRSGANNVLSGGVISVLGLPDAGIGVKSVAPIRNYQLFSSLDPEAITNVITGVAPFTKPEYAGAGMVDAMAIRYIATTTPWTRESLAKMPWYDMVWSSEGLVIYENQRAMPRACLLFNTVGRGDIERYVADNNADAFAHSLERVKGLRNLAPKLSSGLSTSDSDSLAFLSMDGFNPRTMTLVEGGISLSNPQKTDPEKVQWKKVSNYEYAFHIPATTSAAYLYLADSYFPGWEAFIDGVPTKIYRANYAFRAVHLPPGMERTVLMRYTPEGFYTGAIISIVALVGLALYAVFLMMKVDRPTHDHA